MSTKELAKQSTGIKEELAKEYKDRLFFNYSLKKNNTWHVGGCADMVFKPRDRKDLQQFLSDAYNICQDINLYWLGLGSNVLFRDAGINGIVIFTSTGKNNGLNELEDLSEGLVKVGSGVTCAKLAKFMVKNNYPSGAFWAGIPGTVGGALAMNAGCFGSETWTFVEKVEIVDRKGQVYYIDKNDFEISYRTAKLKGSVENNFLNDYGFGFLSTYLKLEKNYEINGNILIKDLLTKRSTSQPIGKLSCGSVFKNPKHNFAAKLIEDSGLKGYRMGGAMVSEKHANFVVNDKTATAYDIERLINHIKDVVEQKTGIKLETEVKVIGNLDK